MQRRSYLVAICSAGVVTSAGCSGVAGEQALLDPSVATESAGEKALIFTVNDEEVGHFGVDGHVDADLIALSTEIWHRDDTRVDTIRLRIWMPEIATKTPAEVAAVSPVEGDSSPPPEITLSTPDRALGTVIEITDIDDLADETISTLNLLVRPGSSTATTLKIHSTIELTSNGVLSKDYTLEGELELDYPELRNR